MYLVIGSFLKNNDHFAIFFLSGRNSTWRAISDQCKDLTCYLITSSECVFKIIQQCKFVISGSIFYFIHKFLNTYKQCFKLPSPCKKQFQGLLWNTILGHFITEMTTFCWGLRNGRMSEFMSTYFNYPFYPLRPYQHTWRAYSSASEADDIHLFQGGKADVGRLAVNPHYAICLDMMA